MRLSPSAYMAASQVREQWTRSKMLDEAIPKLRQALAYHANEEEAFPLFTPKNQEKIWQTVPIDHARKAAVLVPLVSFEGVPSLLFTMRSSNLPTHASEVSFPGGHFDEGMDASLEETAIRETREELLGDYPWEDIEIIGRASTVPSIKGTPVTPIVGVLPYEISHDSFPGSPDEVDEVFCVALSDLINIETAELSKRFKSPTPVFPTREGRKIWGLTAFVTRPLLHKLFKPAFFAEEGKEDKSYPSSNL